VDIFLVRHGEAAASWGQASDPGLSDLGHQQAQSTAQELLSLVQPDVNLISSPLLRAQETAVPLARAMGGVDVSIEKAFSEIVSPVPLPQRQAWLREFMAQQWSEQPESLHAWRKGILDTLLELEVTSVVFTHFLVINAVVGYLQERNETLCFWPDNASIVTLRNTGESLELVALGRQMSTPVN